MVDTGCQAIILTIENQIVVSFILLSYLFSKSREERVRAEGPGLLQRYGRVSPAVRWGLLQRYGLVLVP